MKATNGEEHMYEKKKKKKRTIQICEIDEVVL